jgi:GNAT superfamily N-acetyltransferase
MSLIVTSTAPANESGVAVLADVARSAASQEGGAAEVVAVIVRLLAEDAWRRCTVDAGSATLTLAVDVDGTELALRLRDTGEPVSGPPPTVLSLVDLGLASGAAGGADGSGNEMVVRVPLPAHARGLDAEDLEVLAEDAPLVDDEVELRDLLPEDAPALVRCIYRCYGWSYPYTEIYFPDRIAAAIADGTRQGWVAVAADGEVACHIGTVRLADGVVMAGGGVTDPRFRRRGLLRQLGARMETWIAESGIRTRLAEPVLTHAITQQMSLGAGRDLVGLYLSVRGPLQQVEFTDGMLDRRSSLLTTHHAIVPLEPATLWVPAIYDGAVRQVLEPTSWPREIGQVRGTPDAPPASVMGSSYDAHNQIGSVRVSTVGDDLVEAVDDALTQLARAGAESVRVYLPANQPALASLGAGLGALRLGFAALLPRFGELGDVLVVQWVRDPEVDDSAWVYADDRVEAFARMVIEQARELGDAATRERRRQARRAQLFAALPTD